MLSDTFTTPISKFDLTKYLFDESFLNDNLLYGTAEKGSNPKRSHCIYSRCTGEVKVGTLLRLRFPNKYSTRNTKVGRNVESGMSGGGGGGGGGGGERSIFYQQIVSVEQAPTSNIVEQSSSASSIIAGAHLKIFRY